MDPTIVVRDFADTAPARAPRQITRFTWEPRPAIPQLAASPRDELPPVPFRDCRISFAIDISQSTRGSILAEECAFIRNFTGGLSPEAKEFVRVLPWDEISHKFITVEELEKIDPGGRTDPNVLLRNKEQIDLLQASQLWFLLTDGEIVPNTVRRFAFNINSRSLHGTACVIVIFGKRPAKPILCNVSVGISVFAVTPNCLFIFHDVETHTAYVLQCKGCFNVLLPSGLVEIKLGSTTEWRDIPILNYLDLFRTEVPPPTKLDVNQIQLQSGRKIDLEDLYQGRVSKEIQDEILRNDDNLKSVILVATTRGQNRDIHDWIAARRDTFADLVNVPRQDIDGRATSLVKEVIEALQSKGSNSTGFDYKKAALLAQPMKKIGGHSNARLNRENGTPPREALLLTTA
ncbi:hypothetical protein BDZ45DRAFT_160750 [Acephala macrosclerotiorum]|nr:hypothetical protein BDZ45DRAFT_160750 [Acephala macrosclerotiorum]